MGTTSHKPGICTKCPLPPEEGLVTGTKKGGAPFGGAALIVGWKASYEAIPLRARATVIDDLDAAVLRFLHPIGGRDKQVALALGDDRDFA
jgi:hypothetical protein